MSGDEKQEIERHTAVIRALLKRVPKSVCNGSWDKAVAYKADVRMATKQLQSGRLDVGKLRSCRFALEKYE